jgi:hypothetical protein
MTYDDEFLGRVESYLDEYEGSTPLPQAVREAIRVELPHTRQLYPPARVRRFRGMGIGQLAAAVVIGLAALVGWSLYSQQVGPPASPSPIPSSTLGALPVELRYQFLGPARDIPGTDDDGDRVVLDFRGTFFLVQLGPPGNTFYSQLSGLGEGQFRLESLDDLGLCRAGDAGGYSYSLDADGARLTIAGTDDCSAREDVIRGEFLRVGCKTQANYCLGSVPAGEYSSLIFEPRLESAFAARFGALTYTLTEGWANYEDHWGQYGLTPQSEYERYDGAGCYDCDGFYDTVDVLSDPAAADEDCRSAADGVGRGANDLLDWLSGHDGLSVSDVTNRQVDGLPATSFYLQASADWSGPCEDAPGQPRPEAVPVFFRDAAYQLGLSAGDRYHVTLVDLGDGHTVAVVVHGTQDAALEALVRQAMPIVESFEFPPR